MTALQKQLNAIGIPVGADGIYGDETEKAVQKAYSKLNVPGVSGLVTPELQTAIAAAAGPMNAVIGATPPVSPEKATVSTAPVVSEGMPFVVKAGIGLGLLGAAFSIFGGKKR